MSYNGSGTFNINSTGQPVVTGTAISSTVFNAFTADIGTGLSTALTKDGQTVATARIPFAAGINSSLVTDATNTTTGSIITAGGVGVAKALFVGTTANIAGTTTLAGVTATSITDSGLTSGRVTFASTAGLLADAAALAWDGTSLSATKFAGALNGTVGATTPSTGAFTTGTFSSTLGVTGATTLGSTLVVTAAANSLGLVINGRSSDNVGSLYYYANNGSTNYATIAASATELQFASVPAAAVQTFITNGSERLRITAAGLVGIGTTAPGYKLEVKGASATAGQLSIHDGTGDTTVSGVTAASLLFQARDTSIRTLAEIDAVNTTTNGTAGSMVFQTRISDTLAERMRIDGTNGGLGIGTGATVNYKLEIVSDSAGKPGVGGLWTVVSDERIKSDIVPANLDRCYEIVKSVPLKYFGFAPGVYTDEQIQDKHNLGWIAQDVQKVFKNAVSVKPFTLKTDIPDGTEEYEEQDFTLESVEKTETSIQVINGKAVQVSKVVTSENKVMLFDTVDVVDEAGAAVMVDDKPLTYQMPRIITKTRPKVRHDVIEDCLDLNGAQMLAALYGAVQALMEKVEVLEGKLATLEAA